MKFKKLVKAEDYTKDIYTDYENNQIPDILGFIDRLQKAIEVIRKTDKISDREKTERLNHIRPYLVNAYITLEDLDGYWPNR